MPRTELTPTAAPGCYVSAPTQLTWTAADVANKNSVALTGRELLLIRNSSTTAARSVTITSVPDQYGRPGDIAAFSVPIGAMYVFGPVLHPGWMQPDGRLYFEADNAEIQFCVLRLP